MEEGIYDHEEYAKAMAWTENIASPTKGKTLRTVPKAQTREEKDADWEFIVK